MEFAEFILAHDGDDLGALALSRGKYLSDVEDFDLALTTLEVRRKLRTKVPQWHAVPWLRYPMRLSGEQCSSAETAFYKASVAASACRANSNPSLMAENAGTQSAPEVKSLKKGQKCGFSVADLTGGLGVDSWAFSKVASDVLYNEMQPHLASAAEHNFKALGLDNVQVRCREIVPGNVAEILDGFKPDIIFMDPARRADDGRKVFRLEDCRPDVLKLLPELFETAPHVLLKLSPMADISLVCRQLSGVKEVRVVAADGECKELLLLLERGYEGEYSTILYESGAVLCVDQVQGQNGLSGILGVGPGPGTMPLNSLRGILGGPGPGDKNTPGPKSNWTRSTGSISFGAGQVLFEPGKALLKAGAFDLPCRYGLRKLGRHTHYYIGEIPEELRPFGKCFEILEVQPLNNKTIKDLGKRYPQASVTARNIPLTSEDLRKKLGVKDGGTVHIFGLHSDAEGNILVICSAG